MDKYFRYYDLLGLSPGDSWQTLRDCYKSAVRKWHPDRFTNNERERGIAEEKTKEINRAYQELQEYFQLNGRLPLNTTAPPADEMLPTIDSSCEQTTTPAEFEQRTGEPGTDREPKSSARYHFKLTIILLIAALFVYYHFSLDTEKMPDGSQRLETVPIASSASLAEPPMASLPKKYFTVGSSLGEVHSIQGIPTRTENEVWHYGDSKVIFLNGKVSHWVDSPNHKLSARSGEEPVDPWHPVAQYFTKGSTKAEVRAIQGTPLRENQTAWDYGLSRVYFEGDKVVDWQESPLEPLRIKR